MPRRAILIVASASALLAPQTRVTQTRRHSTTLNPLEQLAEQAQIKAYEASAAAIAATISAKVAEKGDRMPDGMVPIVQEFMRTYLDVVAKQKRDPMEKVPVLKEYLGLVEDQLDEPFVFAPFHEAWTEENDSPHDHLAMDTAFMEPMCVCGVPFHASRRWRLGGLFFDVEPSRAGSTPTTPSYSVPNE